MNIAYFLTPKQEVKTLYDDHTFRRGLDLMLDGGYSVIPVIDREGIYKGVANITDFMKHLYTGEIDENGNVKTRNVKGILIKDIIDTTKYPPASIMDGAGLLIERIVQQNFVPVVDARGAFIGIVTRHSVLEYFADSLTQQA